LWNKKCQSPLPNHSSASDLANQFLDFFEDKVSKIHADLRAAQDNKVANDINDNFKAPECATLLESLAPVTEEVVQKLISRFPAKSCSLDPIPTCLLKSCIDVLLPVVTSIVNLSMSTSRMPTSMKKAVVTPLLKKPNLDAELLKNYRPVSNLSFISKLIERVVAIHLSDHLMTNNLEEVMQSAYKPHHSTETALIKVHNDILRAVDRGQCVLLVLLDLSAAFDTVSHDTLITRLTDRFGITGDALRWFRSYLTDRKQCVSIQGSLSKSVILSSGVPQGSVLGPKLFTGYSAPLGDIMRQNETDFHLYADDSQLHRAFTPTLSGDLNAASSHIVECVTDIKAWMADNSLKLNDDKTEFMCIGTKQQLAKVPKHSIKIGDHDIWPKPSAKNIGAVFDENFSFSKHIDTLSRAARFHIRNIGRIRKYLDTNSTEILVHAFITTKLDHMNSLLYGLPDYQLVKLQRLQNTAARIIKKVAKYDHITPVLCELHWLPVKARIDFKILLLTFKALNGLAPEYIRDMIEPYNPTRSLRSENMKRLCQPATRLKTYGDRSFSCAAPHLWNKLPLEIRQSPSVETFKSKLKTYLFRKHFNNS
jgi:hypothetical protein